MINQSNSQGACRPGLGVLESDRSLRDAGSVNVKIIYQKAITDDGMLEMLERGTGELAEGAFRIGHLPSAVNCDADSRLGVRLRELFGQRVRFLEIAGLG